MAPTSLPVPAATDGGCCFRRGDTSPQTRRSRSLFTPTGWLAGCAMCLCTVFMFALVLFRHATVLLLQAGYGAGTGTLIARSMGDRAAIRSYELDCLVETTGDMSSCYRTGGHFFVLGCVACLLCRRDRARFCPLGQDSSVAIHFVAPPQVSVPLRKYTRGAA